MTPKAWRRLPAPPAGFAGVVGLSPFQAHLLYNRGIRQRAEVEPYLAADSRLLNDPMLFPDMDRAVSRLRKALSSAESIGVFGDFDADGVTGTALLTRALRDLGATVVPYLPDRVDEGHGPNDQAIRMLRGCGVSLLVTVDCGSTSFAEADLAASLGVDTIITDHHSLHAELPNVTALINPRRPDSTYPYPHLTGVGMAFKLVEALHADLGKPWPAHLLELVALGTVADVGPLTGENRYLVKVGLESMNATPTYGIQALIKTARLTPGSLDTESLSFGLIPRLNSAGRLGSARISLDLLTAASLDVAELLADELESKNSERRALSDHGVADAQRQVESGLNSNAETSIVIAESEAWAPGILGLIAGKLADSYHRPAIAISIGAAASRASARSIPGFDIVEALGTCRDMFVRFGGHPRAAGFTMPTSSLPVFKRRIMAVADERLRDADLTPEIEIDCEVTPVLPANNNLAFIESLSPFGEGNPAPVFLTRNARVDGARRVGRDERHLKMRVWHAGAAWDAIAFGQGAMIDASRNSIDLVYTVGLDYWSGTPTSQLTVLDFCPARQKHIR